MKTLVLSKFILLAMLTTSGLVAQPLNLNLTVDVANASKESDQVSLIPTQFEFYQLQPSTTLSDHEKLYSLYKLVLGPKTLYQAKPSEQNPNPTKNPKIENFDTVIQDFPLKTISSKLLLRGTGFDVFSSSNIFQRRLLIDDLCKMDEEKNSAVCKISFPSIQVYQGDLSNISHIRMSVFKKGVLEASDLASLGKNLPTEMLPKKEEFIKTNSRERNLESDGSMKGYFLYANYHFEAALKEVDEGLKNAKTFEWRFALTQAAGRLALLSGSFIIERELQFADGSSVKETAPLTLTWGQYIPADGLSMEEVRL